LRPPAARRGSISGAPERWQQSGTKFALELPSSSKMPTLQTKFITNLKTISLENKIPLTLSMGNMGCIQTKITAHKMLPVTLFLTAFNGDGSTNASELLLLFPCKREKHSVK
jgi:hypothetical protein